MPKPKKKTKTAAALTMNARGQRTARAAKRIAQLPTRPELQVEYRALSTLIPYAKNARTHSDSQVKQIADSIAEFGFTAPVLIDGNNGIIAGHARVLAAAELKMETVPTIELSHLTEAQARAYIIADNKLALNAGWNETMLALELDDLKALGMDAFTGFSASEIERLIASRVGGLTDPDDAPEVPTTAVSRAGDLWLLGTHRLLCGDSTQAADVARVLGDQLPHLMVTDPPYGVKYDAEWRSIALDVKLHGAFGKVKNDDRADWREVWTLFPGSVAYVWHGSTTGPLVMENLVAAGFQIRAQIVWAKSQFVIGRGHYHQQHETCWYAVRKAKSATAHWNGDRTQSTVWQIDKPLRSETGHSTQKPVECMLRPILNNSVAGDAVFDPFVGSGTTLIACEQTGRVGHAIELAPEYVDVAVLRWQSFSGQEARLEATGATFGKTRAARVAPSQALAGASTMDGASPTQETSNGRAHQDSRAGGRARSKETQARTGRGKKNQGTVTAPAAERQNSRSGKSG
jgi:DNA modification methylase